MYNSSIGSLMNIMVGIFVVSVYHRMVAPWHFELCRELIFGRGTFLRAALASEAGPYHQD